MAELLRRQSSIYDNPSCMPGFFHFYQRLHVRKMLLYRKHGDDSHDRRAKLPKSKLSPSIVEEQDFLDTKTNLLMEDNVSTRKRSSGKARMITLISKLYKKKDRKKKISPLASQLLRTISIHHLECNDYVVPEEITSDSEPSTVELDSHETDCSASNEHVDNVGQSHFDVQSLDKAKGSLLKWKDADAKDLGTDVALMSKEFDLFDANRELFLRIPEDPNTLLENYILPQQDSSPEVVLTKSRSFPGAGLSARRHGELSKLQWKGSDSFIDQEVRSRTANSSLLPHTIKNDSQDAASTATGNLDIRKPRPEILDSSEMWSNLELPGSPHKLKHQRDRGTALNRFKVLKQRIKEVILENRKESHRISMDGFMHKIPYGHKVTEVADREKIRLLDEPDSNRCDTNSLRSKFGTDGSVLANSKYSRRSVQRSRSLTESLDKYSRLLESISLRETRRPPEKLNSIKEHDRKSPSPKTWGRMLSSPEFGSYDFSKILRSEPSDAPGSPKNQASGLLVSDAAVVSHGSDDPKSFTLAHAEEDLGAERHVEPTGTDTDQQVLIDEYEQSEPCKGPDDSSVEESIYIPLHEQEARIEAGSHEKLTRPIPISVLDSSCQEGPISPMKYSVTEGSNLKPGWVTFEQLDSRANDISDEMEIIADFDKAQMPMDLKDSKPLQIQVDQKDEPVFKYARDILKKYRFRCEDLLETFYSPYAPVDPLLFEEDDGSHDELNIARDELDDMSTDPQLLFDLVNEILLDIFESSFSRGPGISCFGSRFRPKPMVNNLLDVWAKISWHLSFQRHPDRTFDDIVARDFSKNDGWMNLRRDADCVGVELVGLILDSLLDDVIIEFGDSPSAKSVAF